MADLSQLSDADLMRLYQLQGQESQHAPDNSNITSPKGAQGTMQVMPATQTNPGLGVKPSNGTPEDTAREGRDYYVALENKYKDPTVAAMAYNWGTGNVDKWLASGADISKVPDETLKYAYNFNKNAPTQPAKVDSLSAASAPDYSKMTDDQLKAEYAKQNAPSAANQRGMAAIKAMQPNTQATGEALTGLGETAAQMATGMFGQAAGALHGAADIATGGTYEQAQADVAKEREAATYNPRTQAGQQISQNMSDMFDKYLTKPLEQGGQAVGEAFGFTPTESKQVAEVGTSLFSNLALPGLMHGAVPEGGGAEIKAPAAAGELDKMNTLAQRAPETPVAPASPTPEEAFNQTPTPYRQYFQQPSLLEGNEGVQPEGPTLAGRTEFNEANPTEPRGGLANARQMDLQLEQGEPIRVSATGEAFPESMTEQRDMMQQRTADMQMAPVETLDPMSGVSHPSEAAPEPARSLAPDEFKQAVQTLADRDPTKFSLPADMEKAYQKYTDIVRDESGELTAKGESAKRFAEAVTSTMLEQRVADHPTIKANQARVDALQAKLVDAASKKAPTSGLEKQLNTAQKTLERAQDNIRKFYEPTASAVATKVNGDVVHMYTFGHLPEMMKSIGAILKAVHGMVFKTLDRMIPNFRNLEGMKIAGQGIKNFVNKQATKDWSQTVNEQPREVLNGVPALRAGLKDYLPDQEDIPKDQLKAQMTQAPDISGGQVKDFFRRNFLTGQQLQAYLHHPLVKYAVNTIDNAMRSAQNFVRQELVGKDGLRGKARALSDDELTGVWGLMQMNEGVKEFSEHELRGAGYTDKQIDFYQKRLELNRQKLEALNAGRAEAGLNPVDARIAHIAGHFLGDFKTIIKDGDGTVKAVIAHNSRAAVKVIANRVMEQLGEGHTMSPIEMRKMSEGGDNDRYTGYMNILNDMAGRDPVVDKVVQAYKEYMSNDAQAAMKYRAAFKSKEGVIGAEGRKSWESAKTNAQQGVKNELKALESMNTWSEMQKALSKIKEFQADKEIDAPNAKGMVQKYLDDVQRRNQGAVASGINSIVNGIGEVTGIGPSAMRGMSATVKTGLLDMFIGLGKMSHSFVTLIQPLQGIPVVNSLMKAEGVKPGLTQLTAALKSMGSQAHILTALGKGGEVSNPFVRKALEFAKANDTLNTQEFQFGNLTDINRSNLSATAHKIAEFNVTGVETATRAFTYMYYSHMLKDLGLPEKEIFPAAHNAMKDVMVDYNSWERPGIFGKIGFLGDLTAMLTRYKFNQIDQFARASKYATHGQFGPLLTVLTTSIAAAGVRGIMAYTLANAMVRSVSTWAAENNLMDKPTSIDEILLHALHGTNENLSNAVKFGLPSGLGLNMTGSLSHADDIPNDPFGALIPQSTPIMDMAKSAYNFARDPNKATAKTAFYDVMPNSAKGFLENKMFTNDQGKYTNPHNRELQTIRSPEDQMKRNFGFRPLHEANESLTSNIARNQAESEGSVKEDIVQKVLRQYDSGNKPDLRPYMQKYIANNGDPRDIVKAVIEHQGMGQARTALERQQGIPRGSLSSIFNYERTEKLK